MGQVLHGSATTTHAVRAAIQRSKATIAELSARYGAEPDAAINVTTTTATTAKTVEQQESGAQ